MAYRVRGVKYDVESYYKMTIRFPFQTLWTCITLY